MQCKSKALPLDHS
jgi:hypothetical protein